MVGEEDPGGSGVSHFPVLVIGDDYEAQLAPYHEFECTGLDDEFICDVDRTEQLRDDFAKHGEGRTFAEFVTYWRGKEAIGPDDDPDLEGTHKYGYVVLDMAGEVVRVINRTNPNSKWDWYTVGGRWRGFFQAKAGTKAAIGAPGVFDNAPTFNADSLRKGDVDFAGMRAAASAEAELRYTRYEEIIAGTPEAETWDTIRERHGDSEIEAARVAYHEQPRIKALETASMLPMFDDPIVIYGGGRESFVQRAVEGVAVPFAIVKDGQWVGKGEMGWFGISHDEADETSWAAAVQELYDSLPEDAMLTLVDCHV